MIILVILVLLVILVTLVMVNITRNENGEVVRELGEINKIGSSGVFARSTNSAPHQCEYVLARALTAFRGTAEVLGPLE